MWVQFPPSLQMKILFSKDKRSDSSVVEKTPQTPSGVSSPFPKAPEGHFSLTPDKRVHLEAIKICMRAWGRGFEIKNGYLCVDTMQICRESEFAYVNCIRPEHCGLIPKDVIALEIYWWTVEKRLMWFTIPKPVRLDESNL